MDDVIYYTFKSNLTKKTATDGSVKLKSTIEWRELSLMHMDGHPLSLWEHIRYIIEERCGLHKKAKTGYLCGVLRHDFMNDEKKYIKSNDVLKASDVIILTRHPLPAGLKRHVPARFDMDIIQAKQEMEKNETVAFSEFASEYDKIELLQRQAAALIKPIDMPKKAITKHPSDYTIVNGVATPDFTYKCGGCGAIGEHFRYDCFNNVNNTQKRHPDRVFVAHGIPKAFLKNVSEKCSMKTTTGEFVINEQVEMLKAANVEESVVIPEKKRKRDNEFDFEEYLRTKDMDVEGKREAFYLKNPKLRTKFKSMCTHWLRGLCTKGELWCEFMHVYDESLWPICSFYVKGECLNADCVYRHELPPSLKKPACVDYAKGFCAKGPTCYYRHIKRDYPEEEDFCKNERLFLHTSSMFDNIFAQYKKFTASTPEM